MCVCKHTVYVYILSGCLSVLQLEHITVYFLIAHVCVHQSMNMHLLKAWNNLWSTSKWVFFFLSVAYRPLIIHSCLPAPSSEVGNSIFSLQSNTHIRWRWRGCIWEENRIHHSILWKLAHNCKKNGIPLMWRDATWERPCTPRGDASLKDSNKTRTTAPWSTKPDNSLEFRRCTQGIFTCKEQVLIWIESVKHDWHFNMPDK